VSRSGREANRRKCGRGVVRGRDHVVDLELNAGSGREQLEGTDGARMIAAVRVASGTAARLCACSETKRLVKPRDQRGDAAPMSQQYAVGHELHLAEAELRANLHVVRQMARGAWARRRSATDAPRRCAPPGDASQHATAVRLHVREVSSRCRTSSPGAVHRRPQQHEQRRARGVAPWLVPWQLRRTALAEPGSMRQRTEAAGAMALEVELGDGGQRGAAGSSGNGASTTAPAQAAEAGRTRTPVREARAPVPVQSPARTVGCRRARSGRARAAQARPAGRWPRRLAAPRAARPTAAAKARGARRLRRPASERRVEAQGACAVACLPPELDGAAEVLDALASTGSRARAAPRDRPACARRAAPPGARRARARWRRGSRAGRSPETAPPRRSQAPPAAARARVGIGHAVGAHTDGAPAGRPCAPQQLTEIGRQRRLATKLEQPPTTAELARQPSGPSGVGVARQSHTGQARLHPPRSSRLTCAVPRRAGGAMGGSLAG